MKSRVIYLVSFGVLLIAGCNQPANDRDRNLVQDNTGSATQDTGNASTSTAPPVEILFPEQGEMLTAGRTYTLEWKGGPDSLSIFLIDSALEPAGASVSISDRVYQQVNNGSYEYKVPERLQPGTYKFTIGERASDYFKIVSP